jgi:hypothetical protein
MRILAVLAGVLVVLGTSSSLVRTLIVPRALRSSLSRLVQVLVRLPFQLVADRTNRIETKDRVLAYGAPVAIMFTLVTWLLGYLLGYGLMLYGVSSLNLPAAMREAGSSLFTLGFASSDRSRLTVVDFCAAATGPIAIATLIGYLPTLYAAYARRETEVTLLQARAGEPAWGPEILARHAQVEISDQLVELFQGWERWCADVSESHTSYPSLIHFRSPRATRNWLIGLLAVMDAAALHLALNPSLPDSKIRISLRAGFVCLRQIADTERIAYDADPSPDDPIQLSYEDYLRGIARMRERGYQMERSPEAAWPHFRGWRVNYESVAYALARRIEAVPAPWSGPRRTSTLPMEPLTPVNRTPTVSHPPHRSDC